MEQPSAEGRSRRNKIGTLHSMATVHSSDAAERARTFEEDFLADAKPPQHQPSFSYSVTTSDISKANPNPETTLAGMTRRKKPSRFTDAHQQQTLGQNTSSLLHPSSTGETPDTTNDLKSQPVHRLENVRHESTVISIEDQRKLLHFGEQGLAPATIKQHAEAWRLWLEFLQHRVHQGKSQTTDPFLTSLSNKDQQDLSSMWILWLQEVKLFKSSRIPGLLSNLRSNWVTARLEPIGASGARTTKALKPSENELRIAEQQKRETQKLPLVPEILMALFEERFNRFTVQDAPLPNAEALDSMGAMLSAMLTLESAQRGGNWIKASGTLAQPVRTEDVRFQVVAGATQSSERGVYLSEFIGEAARKELRGKSSEMIDLSQVKRVKEIHINILSTKQGQPVVNQKIARRTKEEEVILEATATWMILSRTQNKDPFLTR